MIAAVVSVGTNSTRALAAELNGTPRILLARSTGTRIGEGLKERGALQAEPMRRTLEALREHMTYVREYTTNVRAIATSALRRAENGEAFAAQVQAIAGAPLEIISGEEEARRSFTGALAGLEDGGTAYGVLDVGGGSSEYATGRKDAADRIVSCEIGAVRLTEAVPELAGDRGAVRDEHVQRARDIAREKLEPLSGFPRTDRAVFVGGTATTSVAVMRGSREPFSYAPLLRGGVQALIAQLRARDLQTRKNIPGINPQRADILLGGLLVLDEFFDMTGHAQAIASTNDLLLGTLLLAKKQ